MARRGTRLFGAAVATVMLTGLTGTGVATADTGGLDRAELRRTLAAAHEAGMPGVLSAARAGDDTWRGAAGVADLTTQRPLRPQMRHRVGSITKSFLATAVLQQVAADQIALDAPIGRYLPDVVPGERGRRVTVRMLLNHTSGIADYVVPAFPSLGEGSTASLDEHRFRHISARRLIELGLAGTPTGEPGARWSYSNTGYQILGVLLERVTGDSVEGYVTKNVIDRAGLRHTEFPRSPFIRGPHSRMYESYYGLITPPRDYSVYDMSWAGSAGALTATMDDLNTFYRALFDGRLIGAAELAEMRRTVPMLDPEGNVAGHYGLGVYAVDIPGCGRIWGHDGAVFGALTQAFISTENDRQIAIGLNLSKYQRLDDQGRPMPHAIDAALGDHLVTAGCPAPQGVTARSAVRPLLEASRLTDG